MTKKGQIVTRYMMATKAMHRLGDISRDEPDICIIESEQDDHFVGQWVTGLGFVNVRFPKDTTRELTEQEVEHYQGKAYSVAGHPPIKLDL